MDNRQKNLLIVLMAGLLWLAAVLVLVFVMKTVQCAGWETKPLDQVNNICLGRAK